MIDFVVVVAVVAAALMLAWMARARRSLSGSPVDVAGLATGPAVVVFTQDDCASCREAVKRVTALGLPVRQVRAEEESEELVSRGVEGVPTTVVVDGSGNARGQFGGVPPNWMLRRAVRRAVEIPGRTARDL